MTILTPPPSSLGHFPAGEKWEFDASVTAVFDDMLERSIPMYRIMRDVVTYTARQYAKDGFDIVALGSSRGEDLDPLIRGLGAYNRFIGLENSPAMLEASRARYAGLIWSNMVDIRDHDLRYDPYPKVRACVTLAVLTLMFTPLEYRPRIVQDVYDTTASGGAFILVEKLNGETAGSQKLITDRYLKMKAENGYSQAEIDSKRKSLEGVQVCLPASANEALLRAAGFRQVECIWRWFNFAAWVAVK